MFGQIAKLCLSLSLLKPLPDPLSTIARGGGPSIGSRRNVPGSLWTSPYPFSDACVGVCLSGETDICPVHACFFPFLSFLEGVLQFFSPWMRLSNDDVCIRSDQSMNSTNHVTGLPEWSGIPSPGYRMRSRHCRRQSFCRTFDQTCSLVFGRHRRGYCFMDRQVMTDG